MMLSIVTLNFKKSHLTINCISSLYKVYNKEFDRGVMEILIVDNASGDDSIEKIQEVIKKNAYKNIRVIANKKNGGFGAGNNTGAFQAKGKYICFLNNDTTVEDNALVNMADYMESNPEIGILGGQLRNADGSLQPSSGKFYTLFNVFLLLMGMQRFGVLDKSPEVISKVDWVKGALLMIRRNVFQKLDGFDENIFMYTEDMELCYRAMKEGFTVYFYPAVRVIHAEQGSSNRTFAIVNIYKYLLYFYKKHRSQWEYYLVKAMLQTKAKTLITYGKMSNNSYLVSTYEQALAGL